MKIRIALLALLTSVLGLVACGPAPTDPGVDDTNLESAAKPVVYTANYPLAYFAERIAGDLADIRFPVPPGRDPAYWKPTAEDVAAMQQADLILLNGADYAKWVGKVTLPESKLVNTSSSFTDRYIEIEDAVVHAHGPEGDHSHAGLISITWLNPKLSMLHAEAILGALKRVLPGDEESLTVRHEELRKDLLAWDRDLENTVEGHTDTPLLASHPVYPYLQNRLSLNLENLHWDPGDMPPFEEWEGLAELLTKHPAKIILWEAEPLAEAKKELDALGVRTILYLPCDNRPENGDFLDVMRGNMERLGQALAAQ